MKRINGKVVKLAADLSDIYPKVYVPNGDFDETVLLHDEIAVSAVPLTPNGFFVEPMEEGWNVGDVLVGVDTEQSFIIAYPDIVLAIQ